MALGWPVVTTTIGCEGLEVVDGEHLLVADDPELFARQAVRLLAEPALCERITTSARQLVVSRYDWDALARQMERIYAEITAGNTV
jgi:glycosyltransferase involved in cell wall biosynthesis